MHVYVVHCNCLHAALSLQPHTSVCCAPPCRRTFLLVMTVYAAAVAKPGHGNTAPLAIGLSLYAAALTGDLLGLK